MKIEIKTIWQTAINLGFHFNETDAHEMLIEIKKHLYTKQEVEKLLNDYGNAVGLEFSDCDCSDTERFSFEEEYWIKENLKK